MPDPTPELIFETFNAYQRTAALRGAIELDVFTAIGEGHRTPAELARRCAAAERGMRILCDYLVVIGLLAKQGPRYDLTPDAAAFLDRRSPICLASSVQFLNSDYLMNGFRDVAAIVRAGGTVLGDQDSLAPEHPMWVEFARSMAPMMGPPAHFIAELTAGDGPCRVLDIAAGHGLFGITMAKQNPRVEVVAQDWANVLQVATENARAAGVEGRYRTLAGSAFTADLGAGFDVVLLTNFLHHFDLATCEALARRVRAALSDRGRVVTLEFVPNEDRVSPPIPAAFALMMLGGTAAGDAYTFAEYEAMFRNAGYSRSELVEIPRSPQRLILSYK